jgi:hypothetical protein
MNKPLFYRAFHCWDTSIQNKLKYLFLDNSDQQFLTLIHFFRDEEELPVMSVDGYSDGCRLTDPTLLCLHNRKASGTRLFSGKQSPVQSYRSLLSQ